MMSLTMIGGVKCDITIANILAQVTSYKIVSGDIQISILVPLPISCKSRTRRLMCWGCLHNASFLGSISACQCLSTGAVMLLTDCSEVLESNKLHLALLLLLLGK